MKILYVTTAMDKDDYKQYVTCWSRLPNPSNQNFHNKLIRALAISNEVQVLSIRPFSKKLCSVKQLSKEVKKDGNITWNYLTIKGGKLQRLLRVNAERDSFLRNNDLKDYVILSDTINPLCIKTATVIAKKKNIPLIGICTDSPSNITGTTRSYTMYLIKKGNKCNGYIALTEELADLFNESGKPTEIVEGVLENEDVEETMNINKPYIFFGGALLERYGIYNLIQAYKDIDIKDVNLFIAGHSGNFDKIRDFIGNDERIHFLGTIDVRDVLRYEKGALLNVNPRPYSEDLDRFSIPSKTIEYLTSGNVTVSVRNSKLQKNFMDDVIWAKSGEVNDLKEALEKALALSKEEKIALGSRAKTKALELYSLDKINEKISQFLTIF